MLKYLQHIRGIEDKMNNEFEMLYSTTKPKEKAISFSEIIGA